jgi:putative GTP pyrophosphokinase
MTYEEFYGSDYEPMKKVKQDLLDLIVSYMESEKEKEDVKSIVYCCSRIKSPDSMLKKLEQRGLKKNSQAALHDVYDAIGVRIICSFVEDVYRVAEWLKHQPLIEVKKEKNYCAYPKPNGYRSYHLVVEIKNGQEKGYFVEIQIRTIAIDFWATLEHQIKYKKDLPHEELIRNELKRCANEIASVDLSMQTIRDVLRENA